MSEKKKEATQVEQDNLDTISKLHKLQKRFFEVCGELFEAMEYIGEPMYNLMLQHYFAQYVREYELMNAEEFIDVDKRIEQLKLDRDREIEAVKLEREKQKKQLLMLREEAIKTIELERAKLIEELETVREKELEEVKLEHRRQRAEIERRKEKLDNEINVMWETICREMQIKAYRIVPQIWRHFNIGKLHFGKVYKNEAMQYVEEVATIEADAYLEEREDKTFKDAGDNIIQVPEKVAKKQYNKFLKQLEKMLRKEKEPEQAEETVEQADEAAKTEAGGKEMPEESGEPDAAADTTLIVENE